MLQFSLMKLFWLRIAAFIGVATGCALACSAGFGAHGRIMTNPTFSWTMHPPVSWTYPDANAIQALSYLPGQSLTQSEALNAASGDITAAALEAISTLGIPSAGVQVRPNFSPPLVNDCVKSALANNAVAVNLGTGNVATQTGPGEQFGIVEQGAVTYLASSQVAITNVICSTRSFAANSPLTLNPFIQSGSVTIDGITLSGWQVEQVAFKMMSTLNFNFNVKFVTPVDVN